MDKDYIKIMGVVNLLVKMIGEMNSSVLGMQGGQLIVKEVEQALSNLMAK